MKELTFEESIEELEKTVNELELQKLTLDESVKKFERGMELSKRCNELLEKAEKNISVLIENASGKMIEESFNIKEE